MSAVSYMPERMRGVLDDDFGRGRVVIFCAEPGMGKTAFALSLLNSAPDGAWAQHHSLSGCSSAEVTERLAELSTVVVEACSAAGWAVVAITHMPVCEECDYDDQVAAIRRMAAAGCLVVLCLRPESEPFADEFDDAVCLRADDLLRSEDVGPGDGSSQRGSCTNGIPVLVDACATSRIGTHGVAYRSLEYRLALSAVVEGCMRNTLPDEERRLRLAMLLLGTGDTDDIAAVAQRLDEDTLYWLARDVPLFGIDLTAGTFSCAGLYTQDGLEACIKALRPFCERMPEVVAQVTQMLACRGDIRRASVTCGMCEQHDLARLGCEWGVELVCHGEASLVRRALSLCESLGLARVPSIELTEEALSTLSDARVSIRRMAPDAASGYRSLPFGARRHRYVELVRACRDLDMGLSPGRAMLAKNGDDQLALDFVDHLNARRLIMEGHFVDAYELLLDKVSRLSPTTLPAALLCDDYQIAMVFLGMVPSEDDQRASRGARQFFEHLHIERLQGYRRMLEPVLGVLTARSSDSGFHEVSARAERMGDQALLEVLYLVQATIEVRVGAYESAHVHALRVCEMEGGAITAYLVRAARLIDALVLSRFGEYGALEQLATSHRPSIVRDLALLATSDSDGGHQRVKLSTMSRIARPRNELWLLNLMYNDFDKGGVAPAFRHNAPRQWAELSRRAVRATEKYLRRYERENPGGPVRRAHASESVEMRERGPHMEVRVMGGFEVLLEGVELSEQFSRRGARQLVALLASVLGHELRRYEIIDSLYPGYDYAAGMQKVYEGTSETRRILRNHGVDMDPILTSRSDGTLRLNGSFISCDVDAFERAAQRVLMSTDVNDTLVGLANRAVALYRGNLYVAQYDARGILTARQDELCRLYVETAMVGAHAALDSGSAMQAVVLARYAYRYAPVREDVVYVLVSALKAVGRNRDACKVYSAYASYLLNHEGRPPEPGIRRLVEDIYPRGGQNHGTGKMYEEVSSLEL